MKNFQKIFSTSEIDYFYVSTLFSFRFNDKSAIVNGNMLFIKNTIIFNSLFYFIICLSTLTTSLKNKH